jgi:hypothetical protein
MSDIIKGVLIALIPSMIVAFITARLTYVMSVRQAKTHKTWEEKYETYNRSISCLSRLLYCYREWMKAYDPYRCEKISGEQISAVNEKFRKVLEELNEIADAGINISAGAADMLRKLCDELSDEADCKNPYEYAREKHELIENCLGDIKVYSKEDLAD